jgi:hypothetical protein
MRRMPRIFLLAISSVFITTIGCSENIESPTAPSTVVANAQASTQQKLPIGGLDLDGYCQSQGFSGSMLTRDRIGPGHAHGNWVCQNNGNRTEMIQMKSACEWQYPGIQVAAKPTDNNDAHTWICSRQ